MVSGASSATAALERQIQGLIRGDETDAEIDVIIADLLAQEARQAGSASRDAGPQRRQLNARFLNSVLRNTETHNRNLREREAGESSSSRHSRRREGDERRSRSKRGSMRGWAEQVGKDEEPESGVHRGYGGGSRSSRGADGNGLKPEQRRSRSPQSRRPSSRHTSSSSKMDRYFEDSYDPALDVRNEIESDRFGRVEDGGWDRVMELAREKEERKRQRRDDRRHAKRDRPENRDSTGDLSTASYVKAGQQRAWDEGKGKSI